MEALELASHPENAKRAERASALLRQGCDQLSAATGLALDPDFLARAMRDPELSTDVCASIESACKSVVSREGMEMAKAGVEAIGAGAALLRAAVRQVADTHAAKARAVSAYTSNQ